QVSCPTAHVDVRPIRIVTDRGDFGSKLCERLRRDPRVRAVCTVDADLQTGEIGAGALDDVLEVAIGRYTDFVDVASASRCGIEQRLDLLFLCIGQLLSVPIEELHAVVFRRVVGRGDHTAEVERQQRHRGRRQNASDARVPTRRRYSARKGVLELGARDARVAADEDAPTAGPDRGGTTETLDEVRRQVFGDNPAHAVGPEVEPWDGGGGYVRKWLALKAKLLALTELRCLAGLVEAGLLALHDPCVTCEEAGPLQRRAKLWIGLDQRAGDAMPDCPRLPARPAPVDAHPDVEGPLHAGNLERCQCGRAVCGAREVLL